MNNNFDMDEVFRHLMQENHSSVSVIKSDGSGVFTKNNRHKCWIGPFSMINDNNDR